MSSKGGLCEGDDDAEENWKSTKCLEEDYKNGEKRYDQQRSNNSTTSSKTSILLGDVKSAFELPLHKLKKPPKKFKHHPYKVSNKRYRTKVTPRQTKIDKSLEIASESSKEHIPKEYFAYREVGNLSCQDPFVCSLYITSFNNNDDQPFNQITIDPFADILATIASGKIRIQRTYCGIVVACNKGDDAEKVMTLRLQSIFKGPVQVARFQTGEFKFHKNVIIKDVPWCISNAELHQALKMQGIVTGKIIRTRTYVKIEVLSAIDMYRLLEEGLNFFNYTSFSAIPEGNVDHNEPDIIQCFKCQGFWHTSTHCRQMPRCVRCGENHDVDYCPRPRSTPICCHCGGPHHAAFKMCPVRLKHVNSTYVGFQLAKGKPIRSFNHNML